ncbi:GNAT family N-acetyltransferase [Kribbella jejuensis]|uniref:N-acetylglutamate synthase-like GNAT family acetyltransferase n=1 Tax=Kribbella jejuensis TaxID=236068 RepID=A0A542E9R3_9ACTN|nr:GNAT family N-acetyltransferase [Kribbella jejuensis]TQJ12074.1 N-acetylglutamate synthase-like GNAT family acetyltransferase [Kribbella jejuensis]
MLRIVQVEDDATLLDWQRVHNEIIPTAPLSVDEIRERSTRNVLEVAYDDDVLVGCSTVRPPSEETAAAVVIARLLPAYRGRGFGTAIYEHCLRRGLEFADRIETHILSSNVDGLRFATARGFVEVETYLLPGDTIPFVELRL